MENQVATIHDLGVVGTPSGMIYQPKLNNRYVAVFYPPSNIAPVLGTSSGVGNAILTGLESAVTKATGLKFITPEMLSAITAQCIKIQKPTISFDAIELYRYNSNIKISQSKYKIDDVNITLEDDIGSHVSRGLQELLNNQHDLIGKNSNKYMATAPTADKYKFSIDVIAMDGGVNKVEIWQYSGCWIKSLNYGEFAWDSSDQAKIDITLSVDHVQQTFNSTAVKGQAIGGENIVSDREFEPFPK